MIQSSRKISLIDIVKGSYCSVVLNTEPAFLRYLSFDLSDVIRKSGGNTGRISNVM